MADTVDETKKGGEWFADDSAGPAPRAAASEAPAPIVTDERTPNAGDDAEGADTIGSPDLFLAEMHKDHGGRIRILQAWSDGGERGYIIADNTAGNSRKLGYFELHEGMPRSEAEKALSGAYDGMAAVL